MNKTGHLDPPPDVQLTETEQQLALYVGLQRMTLNRSAGTPQLYGDPRRDGLTLQEADKVAACAEMLVCKWLGIFWGNALKPLAEVQGTSTLDAGPYQVRSTQRLDGCLILHERDRDEIPVILVVGPVGQQVIRGWILGSWGKKAAWWPGRGSRPCYMVPQLALSHPSLLRPKILYPQGVHALRDPNEHLPRRQLRLAPAPIRS